MVYLTRRETFNAAHKLSNDAWTEDQNKAVFGKCANKNWHGHNYTLFVTVKGNPDPATGFVMNAKELSDIIETHILDELDHKNLNMDVSWIPSQIQPSTENLVVLIWNRLKPFIHNATLHSVKIQETENIYAEYFG
jgi:6-pyruvoyltetrahydropterin/6-carboxytetrahydropterin synthase